MVIDDFVMLGKTVPEPNSDGRIFVCSAGISRELKSLVRIYPLARRHAPPRWTINQVALERNPKDSRVESFKLAGDRSPGAHEMINQCFRQVGRVTERERRGLLQRCVVTSLADANARRLSLAVMHPLATPKLCFDYNPESPEAPQMWMFDDLDRDQPVAGAKRFAYIPRLEFEDEERCPHSLTLRDWGCFEFMRKYGETRRQELANALHLDGCSLLVGNQNHRRTGWLVISVLHGIRPETQYALPFDDEEAA